MVQFRLKQSRILMRSALVAFQLATAFAFLVLTGCSSDPVAEHPISTVATSPPPARLEFEAGQLLVKDASEIGAILKAKIRRAQKIQSQLKPEEDGTVPADPEAVAELRNALRIVLSRPDQDGALKDFLPVVRSELMNIASYQETLEELVREGVGALLSSELRPKSQMTYVVLLENVMKTLRPDLANDPWAVKIVTSIRDADIKLSKEFVEGARLRGNLPKPISPSVTAGRILPKPPEKK